MSLYTKNNYDGTRLSYTSSSRMRTHVNCQKYLSLCQALLLLIIAQSIDLTPSYANGSLLKVAVIRFLDKITGKTHQIEAQIGDQIDIGNLKINILKAWKANPEEQKESMAFLVIEEQLEHRNKAKKIFSGWMIASNPSLSSLEHPIYDIWLIDVKRRPIDKPSPNSSVDKILENDVDDLVKDLVDNSAEPPKG